MALDWAFEIDDRMSSNLAKIEKALGNDVKGMKAAEAAASKLDRALKLETIQKEKDPLKQRALGIALYKEELERAKEQQAKFLGVSTDTMEKFGSMGGIVTGVTGAIAGLSIGVAALALTLTEASVKQGAFRAATLRSLDATLGNTAAAKDSYEWLYKLSQGTAKTGAELVDTFQSLITSGLNEHNAKDIIASAADLAATRGQAASERFLEIFKKTAESAKDPNTRGGIFDAQSFKALDELGAGTRAQFLKTIAAQHKVTERQALMLIDQGRVKATEGLNALMDVNENAAGKGNGVGFTAQGVAAADAATQIKNIEQNFNRLFEMGDGSPLAKALGKIAAMLDPTSDSGKKLQGVMTTLFEKTSKVIEKYLTADNIAKGFDTAITVAETLVDVTAEIVDWVDIGIRQFKWLGRTIEEAIFAGVDAWDNIEAKIEALQHRVTGFYEELFEGGKGLAGSLIDGLVEGITGGFDKASKAIDGLGASVIGGLKKVLGIHSPSRVMMQLGAYTGEGFSMGLERTPRPSLDPVMPRLPDAPPPQPVFSARALNDNGRRGVSVGDVSISVHVSAPGGRSDAQSIASATADAVRAEFLAITEGLATEQGAY